MQSPFTIYLTLGEVTDRAEAETLPGALALAKAFEVEHFDNRDAQVGVYDRAAGTYAHRWIGGRQFGPRDTRHPMVAMLRAAERAGCRVYVNELREGTLGLAPVTRISERRVAA